MAKSFRHLKLGFTSAEEESAREPDLLLAGYFDLDGTIADVRFGPKFLILGYKGSGKSAISEHLKLTAKFDSSLLVTSTYLKDFPYTDFAGIIEGESEPEAKYPTAWAWLLLLNLFHSFSRDEGAASNNEPDFLNALAALRKLGLLPTPDLRQVVLTSSKQSFKIALPSVFESGLEQGSESQGYQMPFFVERLKAIAQTFQSNNQHLLIIDGLDDILTGTKIQYDSLSALVFEVSRLNIMFRQHEVPAKVILLCRTDLFERLPNPNKNKIRQDSAVVLDWYYNTRRPEESALVELINQKARVSDKSVVDVFDEFFPDEWVTNYSAADIRVGLLDWTRHTPRDFIQLLTHIQKFSSFGIIPQSKLYDGVRDYSISYFLPEIKDELSGYIPPADIDAVFNLIGSLRGRDFTFDELEAKAANQRYYANIDLQAAIAALFECSAIGNMYPRPGGNVYFTFKYRNRQSTLNLTERFRIHRGLWKALNLL